MPVGRRRVLKQGNFAAPESSRRSRDFVARLTVGRADGLQARRQACLLSLSRRVAVLRPVSILLRHGVPIRVRCAKDTKVGYLSVSRPENFRRGLEVTSLLASCRPGI